MSKFDTEIVSAVHRALTGRVGHERFAVWFGRGVRMEPCGKTLRIAAADVFRLDNLRRLFRADLVEAARIAGSLLNVGLEQVEFVVDASLSTREGEAASEICAEPPATKAGSLHQMPLLDAAEASAKNDGVIRAADRFAVKNSSGESGHDNHHRPQRRQFANLDDFLASEANRIALTAAQTAATRPGVYSPLTIVGPPGCGKTHLLEGIWRRAKAGKTLRSVIYLSAEQFTNQFIDAIRNTGAPNFRRKIRDVEMLLIDDVQFFAGKQSTLVELVHTIDTLLRANRQLVFAADRPLAELRGLGPELITRLSGGLVCTLEAADFATRLGILRQLAAKQEMTISDDVLTWMAGQLDGDGRHLAGALNRLRAATEAHEKSIDLEFAQFALSDLIQASRRPVRVPDIVEAVCDVMGVEQKDLQSSSKTASVAMPRMLVMFLARKWTRAALSEISRSLGRRSHSTVVSAQHKVTEWLADGKTLHLGHGQCRVEDAIKRIEGKLKLA
ncbi:MAG TPA: DnaA/Hda family protein [Pirellulaceae bacterium]